MKNLYLLLTIGLLSINGYCQQGQWTWMNGNSIVNSVGHFGTQGVFDSLNTPPGIYEASGWTDKQGNFWVYGGVSYGSGADLWEFNPFINQWAWIKGSDADCPQGIWGTQGISSPANNPGCRGDFLTWVDTSGNFWLFGGGAADINNNYGVLNDLWKYDIGINEWTWMKGANIRNDPGYYGTIGIEALANNPPSRGSTNVSWTDTNNNLWLFGGIRSSELSDLWKYNIITNNWTWIKGADTTNQPGVWGTKGSPDPANIPCARGAWPKWKDCNDDLWFFGGFVNFIGTYNDLWRYHIATNEFTWMSGTHNIYDTGSVNGLCLPSVNNIPPPRFDNSAVWSIGEDPFEVFGGYTPANVHCYNDLWDYNIITNEWTLMSGSSTDVDLPGSYGSLTVSSGTNMPMSRSLSIGWKDNDGNLWLFGGTNHNNDRLNDMWRFVPDTTCPVVIPCNQSTGIKQISIPKNNFSIYPNPNNGIFTLFYHLSSSNNELQIIDVLGRTVYTYIIQQTEGTETIDVSTLSNGVYFYQVTNNKETLRGKFVKE